MRMMAGWIALTPELPVKLEMARQVYECALHCDALGKRLGELRSRAQVSRPVRRADERDRRQRGVGAHSPESIAASRDSRAMFSNS